KSRFGVKSFAYSRDRIVIELKMLLPYSEFNSIILSTNIPLKSDGMPYATYKNPDDKGVAVYFKYRGEPVVLCCDAWDKIEHNLHSISETIRAIRAIERWGVSDFLKRSFTGFTALPPPKHWWEILGYKQEPGNAVWDWEGVVAQYKSLAKKYHPDAGGSAMHVQELTSAYDQAKKHFGKTV